MNIVDVDRILEILEELNTINRANLTDIQFKKDGKIIEINPEEIDQWEFIGLNNTAFITQKFYIEENNKDENA